MRLIWARCSTGPRCWPCEPDDAMAAIGSQARWRRRTPERDAGAHRHRETMNDTSKPNTMFTNLVHYGR